MLPKLVYLLFVKLTSVSMYSQCPVSVQCTVNVYYTLYSEWTIGIYSRC